MDGGQFRVPQRTGRGTVSRPEPARRPVEKPTPPVEKPTEEPPRPAALSARPVKSTREVASEKPKRKIGLIVAAAVILVLLVAGWFAWSSLRGGSAPGIDSSKYQAVFLVNGDIYFGKLEPAGPDHMKLTNIYYIQSQAKTDTEETQQTQSDKSNVQLIKLGDEIYGPEDAMILSRDQVMLYENLKPDSKVAKAIDSYKK